MADEKEAKSHASEPVKAHEAKAREETSPDAKAQETKPTEDPKKQKGLIQLLKTEYLQGDIVPQSAIYDCSVCGNIGAFKQGEKFTRCADCPAPSDAQGWYRTNEFVHFVSKNLNTEFSRIETISLRVAEFISEVAGNVWFVYFHVAWFGWWMWVNTGHEVFGISNFDPYPFGFLTMVVSLEAIFLSTFILIAQNLQGRKGELRAELDYQVNLKTEKDVAEVLSILNGLREGKMQLDKQNRLIFVEEPYKRHKR